MGRRGQVKAKVLWTVQALAQLEKVPSKVGRRIVERAKDLTCFPAMGSPLPFECLEGYRQFVVASYRIICEHQVEFRKVYILYIQHSRMHLPTARQLHQFPNLPVSQPMISPLSKTAYSGPPQDAVPFHT